MLTDFEARKSVDWFRFLLANRTDRHECAIEWIISLDWVKMTRPINHVVISRNLRC